VNSSACNLRTRRLKIILTWPVKWTIPSMKAKLMIRNTLLITEILWRISKKKKMRIRIRLEKNMIFLIKKIRLKEINPNKKINQKVRRLN
jgi:hypothetical protein